MADNVHPALSNPEDWEEAAAQAPVALAAMGFLKAAVQDKDLIAAWGAMDPRLQVAWAAAWIEANSSSLVQAGHDLDDSKLPSPPAPEPPAGSRDEARSPRSRPRDMLE